MSYSSAHIPSANPSARAGLIGGGLVGITIFGFYYMLNAKHDRKIQNGKLSAWEDRMMTRTHTASDGQLLKASRVESASQPLAAPTSFHDAQHRSRRVAAGILYGTGDSTSSAGTQTRVYLQPTPQREHASVPGWVYSKKPAWREGAGKQGNAGPI